MIDKTSPIPIYYQIEESIKELIDKGDLKPGDAIPSENEYTELFGVSRMTVRQAITNLVNSGYLYRQKGRGTFVAERKIEQTLEGLTSFTEDMKARGMTPGSRLLQFKWRAVSEKTVANALQIPLNEPIYEIRRIRLANQIPMAFETTYLPAKLVNGLTEEIVKESLYHYIETQLGFQIKHATQEIEAAIARDNELDHLEIPEGAPVLLLQRLSYLENDQPLELVKSVYRADRYKFLIDMKRSR